MAETSIIIRTKNEGKWIGECLKRIFSQTYNNFEVVIVDSRSTDETLEIIKQYPVKLIRISPEKFTYPYAINLGCKNSNAQKYFVIMSAHSLPISRTWLADGIRNFEIFEKEKVMGVYGYMKALPDGSIWEKIYFNIIAWHVAKIIYKDVSIIRKGKIGVLGFTHAIIRKDLWKQYNINENYAGGGEDMDWVRYWTRKGYAAIRDIKFSVYHSHGLGLLAFLKQWFYWFSLDKPQPFRELDFRKRD